MTFPLKDWFLPIAIGLPLVAFITWFRGRHEGWMISFWWRLVICLLLACFITPIDLRIDNYILVLPAVKFLDGYSGNYGYECIAIVFIVLFGVWSLAIFFRRADRLVFMKISHPLKFFIGFALVALLDFGMSYLSPSGDFILRRLFGLQGETWMLVYLFYWLSALCACQR